MMGFKLFFKIIKSNIVSNFAYLLILVVSSLMIGSAYKNADSTEYKVKAPIYYADLTEEVIINLPEDEKEIFAYLIEHNLLTTETDDPLSKGLYDYSLNYIKPHNYVKPENVVEANYTQIIDGALIIPKNLSSLSREKATYIFHTYLKDLAYIEPTKAGLNKYINTYYDLIETYETNGISYNLEDVSEKVGNALKKEAQIHLESPEDIDLLAIGSYYNFATYIISAIIILIIGIVIFEVKRREVLMRISTSPYSMAKLIIGLILGALLFALFLVLLVFALSIVSYTKALTLIGIQLALNLWLFTLPLTALSMFLGLIISNIEVVSMVSTVLALVQAFFSGSFVPSFLLPKLIINLGQIFPATYTIKLNELILEQSINNTSEILLNILYLGLYFALFLVLSIIASHKLAKKES